MNLLIGIPSAVIVGALIFKFWYKWTSGRCVSKRRLDGKVAIVTGSNTGIGKEAARDLARRGAKVILACRDLQRANAARDDIIKTTGNKKVEVILLDLGSLDSVRNFVKKFLGSEKRLDILVNNAAAVGLENKISKDGMQQELQVNHFGPFLLTLLLLDAMEKSAPSRVVVVSSLAHLNGYVDLDDVNCEKKFPGGMALYRIAKLYNVIFSNELSRRLQGTGIICNSVHPGVVNTEVGRRLPAVLYFIMKLLFGFLIKTPEEGAQTLIHLSVSEQVEGVTGKYFVDCQEGKMNKVALDKDLARKFWDKCVELVKVSQEEVKCIKI
ncbi:retinol dehydrogenase 13-like [Neocloeon triangulifer]|uniref:retinol dehydrogenase 13-like n=1 Tax=Neocloeon triangulifer TaxID=2078957 RepID=UPI00286F036D|nr:retinol dehydrogenase 13-like [Neocloeon triangulifer]